MDDNRVANKSPKPKPRSAAAAKNEPPPRRKTSSRIDRSAMAREPAVETANEPMDWKRVAFAGIGAAVLTVLIVYTVFKLFGLAAGVTEGEVTAGEGAFGAATDVSSWTTLGLGMLLTFLGALWSVRETREKHLLQGFLVGLIAAVLILGPMLGFLGGAFNGMAVATFFLVIAAGTVAGFFGK